MTKGRSPNYPRLSLEDAVEKLRPLYKAIHTYPTPKLAIAENLGYTSLSGRILALIGTFRRYGLLQPEKGGNLKITDTAVSILELPASSPEWKRAFAEAAFTPDLFSELRDEYPGQLPNDATLRHNLIKKGFLPQAAEEIIRVFRANLELVEDKGGEYNPPMSSPTPETPTETRRREGGIRAGLPRNVVEENEKFLPQYGFKFNVSRTTVAKVTFVGGEATQEAIDKLISVLEVQKDTFPTEEELRQRDQEGGFAE